VTRKQKKSPAEDPLRNEVARKPRRRRVIPAEIPQNHSSDEDAIVAAEGIRPENMPAIGELAAAEARTWIGTPYHHQASVRRVGCDCLGLVRGVYRGVVGPEPAVAPNYSPGWDEVAKQEVMLAAFRTYLVDVPDYGCLPEHWTFLPGDVLLFRMRPGAVAKHCGIVTESGRFVHSHTGRGTVEIELSDWWRKRIVGLFTFPEPSALLRKVD
jgi:NlpC/P60 family putative phage cell wall peptidase